MTAANSPVQSASPYKGLLARHPLVFYFIIAYAFSWLVWMPLVLSEDGAGLLSASVAIAIASFGPFLAAFIMTGITEGREGIGRLLRRIVLWRGGGGGGPFGPVRPPPPPGGRRDVPPGGPGFVSR